MVRICLVPFCMQWDTECFLSSCFYTALCFKEIQVSGKIRVLPFENFATARRSSKRYYLGSRTVDIQSVINWTVVGQLC